MTQEQRDAWTRKHNGINYGETGACNFNVSLTSGDFHDPQIMIGLHAHTASGVGGMFPMDSKSARLLASYLNEACDAVEADQKTKPDERTAHLL